MTYAISPTDHWKTGDRAYCLRGLKKEGRHIVEKGRMYHVAEATQIKGMMADGLKLVGVDTGDVWGFWSSRFVCIRGRELPIRQIEQRTSRSWSDAYRAGREARNAAAQGIETQRAETEGLGPKDESPVGAADALNELQRLGQDFDTGDPNA